MGCRRALEVEWAAVVVVVAMAAIMVLESGRICFALDMEDAKDKAERAKETALWTGQSSGKCRDKQEGLTYLKNKAEDTASDGMNYVYEKVDADSTPSAKDIGVAFYDEVNKKVEEAYNEVVKNDFSEKAKAKYEALKEKASDAAGEVGAIMRH